MEQLNLRGRLDAIRPRDHIILVHRTLQRWRETVFPFLAEGLRRGERLIYASCQRTPAQIRDLLAQQELGDVDQAVRSGQLIILDAERVFVREGFFDPERAVDKFIISTQQALSAGYSGLRATAEMAWAAYRPLDHRRLVEFERRLHQEFFPHYACTGLCQYDQALFPPELLAELAEGHPLIIA